MSGYDLGHVNAGTSFGLLVGAGECLHILGHVVNECEKEAVAPRCG
jgi:hypothetical protein